MLKQFIEKNRTASDLFLHKKRLPYPDNCIPSGRTIRKTKRIEPDDTIHLRKEDQQLVKLERDPSNPQYNAQARQTIPELTSKNESLERTIITLKKDLCNLNQTLSKVATTLATMEEKIDSSLQVYPAERGDLVQSEHKIKNSFGFDQRYYAARLNSLSGAVTELMQQKKILISDLRRKLFSEEQEKAAPAVMKRFQNAVKGSHQIIKSYQIAYNTPQNKRKAMGDRRDIIQKQIEMEHEITLLFNKTKTLNREIKKLLQHAVQTPPQKNKRKMFICDEFTLFACSNIKKHFKQFYNGIDQFNNWKKRETRICLDLDKKKPYCMNDASVQISDGDYELKKEASLEASSMQVPDGNYEPEKEASLVEASVQVPDGSNGPEKEASLVDVSIQELNFGEERARTLATGQPILLPQILSLQIDPAYSSGIVRHTLPLVPACALPSENKQRTRVRSFTI